MSYLIDINVLSELRRKSPDPSVARWFADRALSSHADPVGAYFSPSWTPFQVDRGRDFSVIVDGVSV